MMRNRLLSTEGPEQVITERHQSTLNKSLVTLVSLLTGAKVAYDSTFVYYNQKLINTPNYDVLLWNQVVEKNYEQALKDPKVLARFGPNANQSGNMVATKAPELKWNILSLSWNRGLKFRLFEAEAVSDVTIPIQGSKQQGKFALQARTVDGVWKVDRVNTEDSEQCIPLTPV
jgi:hypothetical protein